jgi:LacI family transcriptional regulator
MLFIGSSVHDDYLKAFESEPYPFLLVNHHFPSSKVNSIEADYVQSAKIAAQHLLDLGHRKIGLIVGTNTHTSQQFHQTFTSYCAAQGVKGNDLPWADGWFTEQGGQEAAQWLLDRYPDLTAIMAGNDKMAIGAMRYLIKKGMRIPDDVSVMGMDDIPPSQFTIPGLTTVRHDLYKMGRLAVDNVLSMFRNEKDSCHEVMPVRIEQRESTGPVRRR